MANSGNLADSNKSQFFITYAKQPHLDGKHTIFGKVIDGADLTLDSMERVPVNNKNRPLNEIKLTHACFFFRTLLSIAILIHHVSRLQSIRILLPTQCWLADDKVDGEPSLSHMGHTSVGYMSHILHLVLMRVKSEMVGNTYNTSIFIILFPLVLASLGARGTYKR